MIFFQFTYSFQPHYGPGVDSASNINENQKQKIMFLESRARPVRRAEKITAICEPIAYAMWDP
jgi:hypothetical protein